MEPTTDHDLLWELRGDVKALRAEVKDINDSMKGQLLDHEMRLRFIERYVWGAVAVISVVVVVIGWYIKIHF